MWLFRVDFNNGPFPPLSGRLVEEDFRLNIDQNPPAWDLAWLNLPNIRTQMHARLPRADFYTAAWMSHA